jgi:hypothetical protein
MTLDRFPHCDQRVLHAPGECEFCDGNPDWQALREAWGISFTGHAPRGILPTCDHPMPDRYLPDRKCQQPRDHEGEHLPYPAWDILPCPADFARPEDSPGDHRRWPGNRPEGYA